MKKIVLIIVGLVFGCFAIDWDEYWNAFEKDLNHPCTHIKSIDLEDVWIYDDTLILQFDSYFSPDTKHFRIKEIKIWKERVLNHDIWHRSERIGTQKLIPEHFGVEWDK